MRLRCPIAVVAAALSLSSAACTHVIELVDPPSPPAAAAPTARPVVVGLAGDTKNPEMRAYLDAIARGLQTQGAVQRVVHPYAPGTPVDVVADVRIAPEYDGSGWNFLINFPGFLVFAPAWNGYVYHANPKTTVELRTADGKKIDTVNFEHDYSFRQADIGRTWTEISWFEVGAIALVGGVYCMNYDVDQTLPFIEKVAPNYGAHVAQLIADRVARPTQP
jgi:hypothetical protein